ncbi:MAG: RnfABCDGE type electron transport complex subunit G [Bacteroidaceae bacterium]|nr:RnfABCDGE type electron transport complex subunit G [Bacteroidaceae bacterium]
MSKKLESTLPNMVIVLTLIAVVAGLALGYVNSVTAGPIEEIKAQQLSDGIKAVLAADELKVEEPVTLDDGSVIYRTDKGVAVQATDPNGFGGKLTVLVGFNADGLIQGYRVLETSETPGLGAKAGEWFQKGQKGDIIGKQAGNLSVTKDGGEVDAITASTITSRAFLRCVNAAYAALGNQQDAQTGATQQCKEEKEVTNE